MASIRRVTRKPRKMLIPAISTDNAILGSYCHGLFDTPEALAGLLTWAGLAAPQAVDFGARREADINRLADAVEAALKFELLGLG